MCREPRFRNSALRGRAFQGLDGGGGWHRFVARESRREMRVCTINESPSHHLGVAGCERARIGRDFEGRSVQQISADEIEFLDRPSTLDCTNTHAKVKHIYGISVQNIHRHSTLWRESESSHWHVSNDIITFIAVIERRGSLYSLKFITINLGGQSIEF